MPPVSFISHIPLLHSTISFVSPAQPSLTTHKLQNATAASYSGLEQSQGILGLRKKEDYTYSVPQGTLHVSLSAEDKSANTLNIGNGNGKVTLQ